MMNHLKKSTPLILNEESSELRIGDSIHDLARRKVPTKRRIFEDTNYVFETLYKEKKRYL